jgi:hypothetical protein
MWKEPVLASLMFRLVVRLDGLRETTEAEIRSTKPLYWDEISRPPAYKEKMLPIRQQLHCVNCIAITYTSLSAEVKKILRYILTSTYAFVTERLAGTGMTLPVITYRLNTV